jgi:hypothetical protein
VWLFIFGILGINEWIIVFISTLMWFLNVVLPVIMGVIMSELQKPLAPNGGNKELTP